MSALSQSLDDTTPTAVLQPANQTCEQLIMDESTGTMPPCALDAEYLVECAGYSCADHLAQAVEVGESILSTQIEMDPPFTVRVTLYRPGQPIITAP